MKSPDFLARNSNPMFFMLVKLRVILLKNKFKKLSKVRPIVTCNIQLHCFLKKTRPLNSHGKCPEKLCELSEHENYQSLFYVTFACELSGAYELARVKLSGLYWQPF